MKHFCLGCFAVGQLLTGVLHSQYYFSSAHNTEPELLWEAGASAGAMNCLTDLGGASGSGKKFIRDINWNQAKAGGTLFASASWHTLFSLRLEGTFGQISGSDYLLEKQQDEAHNRYLRHLQFRSSITELALLAEVYPLQLLHTAGDISLLNPYLIAGAGGFYYNPQAWFNHTWVDLRPLHTEGEGFSEYPDRSNYAATSWCVPAGAGLRYDAGSLINLRLEFLYRFTGTDYLDDVSTGYINPAVFGKHLRPTQTLLAMQLQDRSAEITGLAANLENSIRGNPRNRDAWFTIMLKASIAIGRIKRK